MKISNLFLCTFHVTVLFSMESNTILSKINDKWLPQDIKSLFINTSSLCENNLNYEVLFSNEEIEKYTPGLFHEKKYDATLKNKSQTYNMTITPLWWMIFNQAKGDNNKRWSENPDLSGIKEVVAYALKQGFDPLAGSFFYEENEPVPLFVEFLRLFKYCSNFAEHKEGLKIATQMIASEKALPEKLVGLYFKGVVGCGDCDSLHNIVTMISNEYGSFRSGRKQPLRPQGNTMKTKFMKIVDKKMNNYVIELMNPIDLVHKQDSHTYVIKLIKLFGWFAQSNDINKVNKSKEIMRLFNTDQKFKDALKETDGFGFCPTFAEFLARFYNNQLNKNIFGEHLYHFPIRFTQKDYKEKTVIDYIELLSSATALLDEILVWYIHQPQEPLLGIGIKDSLYQHIEFYFTENQTFKQGLLDQMIQSLRKISLEEHPQKKVSLKEHAQKKDTQQNRVLDIMYNGTTYTDFTINFAKIDFENFGYALQWFNKYNETVISQKKYLNDKKDHIKKLLFESVLRKCKNAFCEIPQSEQTDLEWLRSIDNQIQKIIPKKEKYLPGEYKKLLLLFGSLVTSATLHCHAKKLFTTYFSSLDTFQDMMTHCEQLPSLPQFVAILYDEMSYPNFGEFFKKNITHLTQKDVYDKTILNYLATFHSRFLNKTIEQLCLQKNAPSFNMHIQDHEKAILCKHLGWIAKTTPEIKAAEGLLVLNHWLEKSLNDVSNFNLNGTIFHNISGGCSKIHFDNFNHALNCFIFYKKKYDQ